MFRDKAPRQLRVGELVVIESFRYALFTRVLARVFRKH
jgi:hypothetical protein